MFVELGRLDEAKAAVVKAKEFEPNVAQIVQFSQVVWWWAIPDLGNDYRRAFVKAGLELTPPE